MTSRRKRMKRFAQFTCRFGEALVLVALFAVALFRLLPAEARGHGLLDAARDGSLRRARFFLRLGADVNFSDGGTALHLAALRGDVALIQLLLQCGADVNASSPGFDQPIDDARIGNHPDAERLLLEYGANPDANRHNEFECSLVADRETYTTDEVPDFSVRIRNRSARPIVFVGRQDGSELGRSPKAKLEVLDASGEPRIYALAVCGNRSEMRLESFITLAPGESYTYRDALPIFYSGSRPPSGTYTVRFSYSSSSKAIRDYLGDERLKPVQPEIARKFSEVEHVELRSNEVTVTILPKK